eukprot:jgi/Ulvmu1/5008/UM021_0025.1
MCQSSCRRHVATTYSSGPTMCKCATKLSDEPLRTQLCTGLTPKSSVRRCRGIKWVSHTPAGSRFRPKGDRSHACLDRPFSALCQTECRSFRIVLYFIITRSDMKQAPGDLAVATLELADGAWLLAVDGHKQPVLPDTIKRSHVLRSLCSATCDQHNAVLPLPVHAAQLWLAYVQSAPVDETGTPGDETELDHLWILLQAADILIDERAKSDACQQIMRHFFPSPGTAEAADVAATPHTAAEVLLTISTDLALSVLRAPPLVPLSRMLLTLPPPLHLLAMHAHNPSLDSHGAVHLHSLSAAALPHATAAAVALPRFTHLSLAGQNLPPDGATLPPLLASLPHLLSLDLSSSIRSLAAVQRLAAALHHVPDLTALDLSRNCLNVMAMHALCSSFPSLLALRELNLLQTTRHNREVMVLAEKVTDLPVLHRLAIGSWRPGGVWTSAVAPERLMQAVLHLLPQLATMPTLRTLELAFDLHIAVSTDWRPAMRAISNISQIESLSITLPTLRAVNASTARGTCGAPDSYHGGLEKLTELTVKAADESTCEVELLPELQTMTLLQALTLPSIVATDSFISALHGRLQSLPDLASFSLGLDVRPNEHELLPAMLQQLQTITALHSVRLSLLPDAAIAIAGRALMPLAPRLAIRWFDWSEAFPAQLLPRLQAVWLETSFALHDFCAGAPKMTSLRELAVTQSAALDGLQRKDFCCSLSHLHALQELTVAVYWECDSLLHGVCEQIPGLAALTSVCFDLGAAAVEPELAGALQHACEAHGRLVKLRLSGECGMLAPLEPATLTSLQILQLDFARDGAAPDAEAVRPASELESGRLATAAPAAAAVAQAAESWAARLKPLVRLRELSVHDAWLQAAQASQLAALLQQGGLPALEYLNLRGCRVGEQQEELQAALPEWVQYEAPKKSFKVM